MTEIDLAGYRTQLEQFKALDFTALEQVDVTKRLIELISETRFWFSTFTYSGLYRSRANDTNESFSHVSQLWYPPARYVSLGRCNHPLQPRLYGATSFDPAFWEIRPKPRQRLTTLYAAAKDGKDTLVAAVVGLSRSLSPHTLPHRPAFSTLVQEMREVHADAFEQFLLLDGLFDELMTSRAGEQQSSIYKATVAISDFFLVDRNYSSLMYPSVAHELNGMNLIMGPEFADMNFNPVEAWEFWVDEGERGPPTLSLLPLRRSNAIHSDGSIEWLDEGIGVSQSEFDVFLRSEAPESS